MADQSTNIKGDYILEHGHQESARLHMQDWLWRIQLGGLLRPKITNDLAAKGSKPLNIVDVGSGNCIWLIAAALENPTWSFTGLDVSKENFPKPDELPANLKLDGNFDAFDPIPESMQHKFDIVHVRAFGAIVKKGNPEPLARNLLDLLRPDGYIQWEDIDITSIGAIPSSTRAPIENIEEFHRRFLEVQKVIGVEISWVPNLPQTFKTVGLELIEALQLPDTPALRKSRTEKDFFGIQALGRTMGPRMPQIMGQPEDYQELTSKVWQEIQQGAHITTDSWCVVGRKPQ